MCCKLLCSTMVVLLEVTRQNNQCKSVLHSRSLKRISQYFAGILPLYLFLHGTIRLHMKLIRKTAAFCSFALFLNVLAMSYWAFKNHFKNLPICCKAAHTDWKQLALKSSIDSCPFGIPINLVVHGHIIVIAAAKVMMNDSAWRLGQHFISCHEPQRFQRTWTQILTTYLDEKDIFTATTVFSVTVKLHRRIRLKKQRRLETIKPTAMRRKPENRK